jgi:hypothetical protein
MKLIAHAISIVKRNLHRVDVSRPLYKGFEVKKDKDTISRKTERLLMGVFTNELGDERSATLETICNAEWQLRRSVSALTSMPQNGARTSLRNLALTFVERTEEAHARFGTPNPQVRNSLSAMRTSLEKLPPEKTSTTRSRPAAPVAPAPTSAPIARHPHRPRVVEPVPNSRIAPSRSATGLQPPHRLPILCGTLPANPALFQLRSLTPKAQSPGALQTHVAGPAQGTGTSAQAPRSNPCVVAREQEMSSDTDSDNWSDGEPWYMPPVATADSSSEFQSSSSEDESDGEHLNRVQLGEILVARLQK